MPICDVIVKHSSSQVAACGKIETGAIRIGSKVFCLFLSDVMSKIIVHMKYSEVHGAYVVVLIQNSLELFIE